MGFQPGPIGFTTGAKAGYQRPEIGAVVLVAQVADFVGNKIIDYSLGGQQYLPVILDYTFAGAVAPFGARRPDFHQGISEPCTCTKLSRFAGEDVQGLLLVPTGEQRADLFLFRHAHPRR